VLDPVDWPVLVPVPLVDAVPSVAVPVAVWSGGGATTGGGSAGRVGATRTFLLMSFRSCGQSRLGKSVKQRLAEILGVFLSFRVG
jgi:hypothetical protein